MKMFHKYYDNKYTNTNKEMKLMAQWIGEELIKSPPINDKKEYKKKQVQRDLNEVLNDVLLQDN